MLRHKLIFLVGYILVVHQFEPGEPVAITAIVSTVASVVGKLYAIGKTIASFNKKGKNLRISLDSISIIESLHDVRDEIIFSLEKVPEITDLRHRLSELSNEIGKVESLFERFIELADYTEYEMEKDSSTEEDEYFEWDETTLRIFANETLSDNFGMPMRLNTINWAIVKTQDSIIEVLSKHLEHFAKSCRTLKSQQQYLHNLLEYVILAELKGYATMQFCIDLQRNFTGRSFKMEQRSMDRNSAIRINNTISTFNKIMKKASRDIMRCDPVEQTEGETYTELKEVFQKIMFHEYDFNIDMAICMRKKCNTIQRTDPYQCFYKGCSIQRPCNNILDCDSTPEATVCISVNQTNGRRYEYVHDYKFSFLEIFKSHEACDGFFQPFYHITGHYTQLIMCGPCECTCAEDTEISDQYIDLGLVESDIKSKYVVTGLQFKKENHVLHIQIQQGKIHANGSIDIDSVHWKPIDNYTINPEKKEEENGVKYHTLGWYGNRSIYLDDIESPKDHVITGIRFVREQNGTGNHLKLQILSTPYDFFTGHLKKNESSWYSANYSEPRVKLNIENLDAPTLLTEKNTVDSKSNQYLEFTPTGLRRKDAGQSTVPFIDLQPVVSYPPSPISGAGIYHRGNSNSGGFLALKLFTYDIVPQLQKIMKNIKIL